MGRGFLHVTERYAGVKSGGNEGVAQGVRADRLGDPGPAGDTSDDPGGAVAVEAVTVAGSEDWTYRPFADR